MYHHPAHVQIQGKSRHLGAWKRDVPDHRDLKPKVTAARLPPQGSVKEFPNIPIRDQGEVGSCTGHGTTFAGNHLAYKLGKPVILSPLYLYYFTRVDYEHVDPTEDSGAQVRNAVKCFAQYGTPHESDWPYSPDTEKRFSVRPSRGAIKVAHTHQALKYVRLPDLKAVKQAIVSGYPVVGGFTCYESLQSDRTAKTGIVPNPKSRESTIGGHCVAFTAFDDSKKLVRFVNSWGTLWGDKGCGYLGYWYFEEGQADDFWIITSEMV